MLFGGSSICSLKWGWNRTPDCSWTRDSPTLMALSTKDRIALPVAILLGTAFGYFSTLTGYGGLLIGGFYGILIVPLVVAFLADQRKLLVWQACIIPFALWVIVENARLGALGITGAFGVFYIFWAVGTVISGSVAKGARGVRFGGYSLAWCWWASFAVSGVTHSCFSVWAFYGLCCAW